MRPTHLDPFGADRRQTSGLLSQAGSSRSQDASMSTRSQSYQSAGTRRFEDSWIAISSHPSSSSLTGHNDIITTGLQLRRSQNRDRQARTLQLSEAAQQPRSTSATGSSQDEYEESESESDRVLSSSNEDINNQAGDDGEEEDDTHTALGVRDDRNMFTPQPNAFSHPPSARSVPLSVNGGGSAPIDSYFPPQQPQNISSSHRLPSNRLPNIQRPSHQRATSTASAVDHDAALRASLTTLLSCANAVRKDRDLAPRRPVQQSNQPAMLRLVPESELNAPKAAVNTKPLEGAKRRSRESSKDRQSKKAKALAKPMSDEMIVSSTMLTWVSAGAILVVFSAISFSAGYAWGKEVGYVEAQLGLDSASCGREAMRGSRTGLSKLRLGSV